MIHDTVCLDKGSDLKKYQTLGDLRWFINLRCLLKKLLKNFEFMVNFRDAMSTRTFFNFTWRSYINLYMLVIAFYARYYI